MTRTDPAVESTTPQGPAENRWYRVDRRHALESLLRLVEQPHAAVREVAESLQRIDELSQSVRQRANASARGLRKKISSLEHAVVYLGLAEIRRMVREQLASVNIASQRSLNPETQTTSSHSERLRESA